MRQQEWQRILYYQTADFSPPTGSCKKKPNDQKLLKRNYIYIYSLSKNDSTLVKSAGPSQPQS